MTLHDWIDELCDALEIDSEIDEALVLDVARDAAVGVEKGAGPVTAFLLGYAAALHGADPETVEELAGRATALAERWGGESISLDDFDDVEVSTEDDIELVDVD